MVPENLMVYWKELCGAPSEGGIAASSSFHSFNEPRFIEPVGLWNQQRGPAHTQPKYFAPNGGKVVNLSGFAEKKAVNCMMK